MKQTSLQGAHYFGSQQFPFRRCFIVTNRIIPTPIGFFQDGETPLMVASELHQVGCFQALLDAGADIKKAGKVTHYYDSNENPP